MSVEVKAPCKCGCRIVLSEGFLAHRDDPDGSLYRRYCQHHGVSTLYPSQEAYYQAHVACPKCGYDRNAQTYVGHVFIAGKPFKDDNEARCRCGWRGTVDELEPLPPVVFP